MRLRHLTTVLAACGAAATLLAPTTAAASNARAATTGPPIAAPEQAPWSAFIALPDGAFCSGSVIDATHVLTAGHCTRDGRAALPASAYRVLVGLTRKDQQADPARYQRVAVTAAAAHPYYSFDHSSDDVAVLTLATPLTFTPAVQPIALAPVSTPVPTAANLLVVGWGVTRSGEPDAFQHAVTIRRVERASCATGYPGVLCAGASNQAVCPGDSGAGLVLNATGNRVLIGNDSFGASGDRCVAGTADGFADLASPEIGLWLRGVAKPPRGPHTQRAARVVAHAGHRVSCKPPRWTGKPKLKAAFFLSGSPKPAYVGTKRYRVPRKALRRRVTCMSIARNRNGTARALSNNYLRFR